MEEIKYQIIQVVKKSEKAEVCFAAMEEYDKPVIVKKLYEAKPELYRILSGIHTMHLPEILALAENGEELLVVEEFIDGCALDEYLEENNLSDIQKMKLMLQLCEALEVLHSCEPPVVHRDIKPSNILVTRDGIVKVIDFDASRQYKSEKNTSDTRLLGTIEYAAPEQFGYAQTDPRSDIYSMGVVFSELGIGQNPLIAKAWKQIVDKCTSFDPANRYKEIQCVKKDVSRCMRKAKYPWATAVVSVFLVLSLCAAMIFAVIQWKNWMQEESKSKEAASVPESTEPPETTPVTEATPVPEATPTPNLSGILTKAEKYGFYQGPGKEKNVLWYQKEILPNQISSYSLEAISVQTGEVHPVAAKNMYWTENVLVIASDCFADLEPGMYCLCLDMEVNEEQRMEYLGLEVHSAEEEPDSEGKVLCDTRLQWLDTDDSTVSCVLRPDAMCAITEIYICRQEEADDPFSETITQVYETLYEWLDEKRGICFGEDFYNLYGTTGETVLYIEFDDGRGERVWITDSRIKPD